MHLELNTAIIGELELVARYVKSETGDEPSLDELVETMLTNQLRIILQTEAGYKVFALKHKSKQADNGQGKANGESNHGDAPRATTA